MDNQQATMVTLDWFIGFMEGEGCFIDRRSNAHLRLISNKAARFQDCQVRISNTEMDLIVACQKFLYKNIIPSYVLTSKRGKNKPLHELYIAGANNCRVLYELVAKQMDCRLGELERIIGASTTTRETPCNLNWLTGFYEAEGCFTIDTQRHKGGNVSHKPVVTMENTNFIAITKTVKTLFSLELSWYISDRIPENPNHKPSRRVKIEGCKRVIRFIKATKDLWIGSKTIRKVKLLKEFCDSRLSKGPKEPYLDSEHRIAQEIKVKI